MIKNEKEHLHTDVDFYNKGVEVTKDTVLPHILVMDKYHNYREHYHTAINDLAFLDTVSRIYIILPNYNHTQIYSNGKLRITFIDNQ